MPYADRALVVGISRYPGLKDLSGPENDAQEFYKWVTSPTGGGVAPGNAKLIVSSHFPVPGSVREARPAPQEVIDFFLDLDEAATENNKAGLGVGLRAGNRLWMFFAGHGFAPSLETSGVLMANATSKVVFNICAVMWANRLYEGAWFNEVLLFQDACRERVTAADLALPVLSSRPAPATHNGRRFYAFSSRDQKFSKELPFSDGTPTGTIVRGVFAATLMDGLRGAARDKVTGAITTTSLKTYLTDNMKTWLPAADIANPDIAKVPDFKDDLFDIVPAPPAPVPTAGPRTAAAPAPAADKYNVAITLPAAGLSVTLQDGSFQPIMTDTPAQVWLIALPKGLYRVVMAGRPDTILFEIAGPGSGAGGVNNVPA